MTTYTATQFMSSPAFVKIAFEDAIKLVAKTNNQTVELTQKAFDMEVTTVVVAVAKLMVKAAEVCAQEANQGTLWKANV
jgi:hypothetical protein